ncbi:MAG: hypothetical protein ABIK79_11630 [Chloroflexota bacterium]
MADSICNIGNRKRVFIDWDLIEPGYGVACCGEKATSWEMPYGVQIAVHAPRIYPRPLVWPENPWESRINVYSTLFEDEGRYRLYYECYYLDEKDRVTDFGAMMAYAESIDGVNWVKPKIGTIRFNGSVDNNLVYGLDLSLGRGAHAGTVFKDPNAPSDQRYKLVHTGREAGRLCVFGAISPDGLRWKALKKPLIADYKSDTQTGIRFDSEKGRYVGYFRGWKGLEPGKWHGRRTIAYAESDRFETWPVPQTIVAPDVNDNPDTDIYTNSYTRWPGVADAHLMFPAFYQRALDVLEVHLMTSRDGLRWERPTRRPIIPSGEPGSDWEGGVYAGCGLVSMQPGEWSLPIGPKWHTHNQGRFPEGWPSILPNRGYLCRAIWRQDGFTSLEAQSEGKCSTVPITFSGKYLEINAWTRFAGEIRVELAEASGETIAAHTFADCDPISGDALKHTVTWKGESDLSAWAGKPMRLRFWLRRARLYAIQFV